MTEDCFHRKNQVGSEQCPFREDSILKEEMNANSSTNFLCAPFISLIRWQFQAFTPVIEKHYANLAQIYTFFFPPQEYEISSQGTYFSSFQSYKVSDQNLIYLKHYLYFSLQTICTSTGLESFNR